MTDEVMKIVDSSDGMVYYMKGHNVEKAWQHFNGALGLDITIHKGYFVTKDAVEEFPHDPVPPV